MLDIFQIFSFFFLYFLYQKQNFLLTLKNTSNIFFYFSQYNNLDHDEQDLYFCSIADSWDHAQLYRKKRGSARLTKMHLRVNLVLPWYLGDWFQAPPQIPKSLDAQTSYIHSVVWYSQPSYPQGLYPQIQRADCVLTL